MRSYRSLSNKRSLKYNSEELPWDMVAAEHARRSLMHFAGYTFKKYRPNWHHKIIASYLEKIESGEITRLIILVPPRYGKALGINELVPTPLGWSVIGKLKIGDYVFDENGKPTKIIAISSVWKNRQLYRAKDKEGNSLIVDENHEWLVRLCRKHKAWKRYETKFLAKRTSLRKPLLPLKKALKLPQKNLSIHPYVLGVWLGDGTSRQAIITQGQKDFRLIKKEIENCGFKTSKQATQNTFGILGLKVLLRENKLLGNKHIPSKYLRASFKQRFALLQGLIDTDGYVSPVGQIEFCATNKKLALNTAELIRTLGVKCSINKSKATLYGRVTSTRYRLSFFLKGVARLPRKNINTKNGIRTPGQYITFEKVGIGSTVCIEVESKSHLFLAGKGFMPTSNSELASIRFPAWYLGRHPNRHIISVSYGDKLVKDFGRKTRDLVESPTYQKVFRDLKLSQDSRAIESWDMPFGGSYRAAGIGGAITGKGAHVLIIDDPIKNDKEAFSETYRDSIWNWYTSTAYSRLEERGAIVLILTHWHKDDLAGRLLEEQKKGGEEWVVVKFPAIAIKDEKFRKKGEPLWPEKYSLEDLMRIRAVSGSYFWPALYQQDPTEEGGNILKRDWWKYVTTLPSAYDLKIQSWDTAFEKGKEDAYSVCETWGRTATGFYLIDVYRKKVEFPELKRDAINLYSKYKPNIVLVEKKASGHSLIQELKRNTSIPILEIEVDKDKIVRAHAVAPLIESGNVYLPYTADWQFDFLEECGAFPAGKYADQVDALSQALQYLKEGAGGWGALEGDEFGMAKTESSKADW